MHYTLKSAKYGLIISGILQLVKSLRALAKSTKHFKKSFSLDYLTIILFLCSSTLVLRLVKCALRWIRDQDDGINSFIAGCAAGWVGTKTLHKDYWYLLLMFIGSRVLGSGYQSLLQKKYLDEKNNSFHYYFMFLIAHATHSYAYFIEPDILKPDMYNLY